MKLCSQSIRHLCEEPDTYLKSVSLGNVPAHRFRIMLVPARFCANRHLLRYWRKYFWIATSPTLCRLLQPLEETPLLVEIRQAKLPSYEQTRTAATDRWRDKQPLLKISVDDLIWGRQQLSDQGIPNNGWFVCIQLPDQSKRGGRAADLSSYHDAIRAITGLGGWCIRLGDRSSFPIGRPGERVFDYALSEINGPRMDLFLSAECVFYLGEASSLFFVATTFGRPCALVNSVPFAARGRSARCLCIPKLIRDSKSQRTLSFQEILDSPIANVCSRRELEDQGLEWVDNSAQEIAEITSEMLAVYVKGEPPPGYDQLWQRYSGLLPDSCRKSGAPTEISRAFLRRHEPLFGSPSSGWAA